MRARVKRRLALDPSRQAVTVLRAGDYAEVLGDYDAALASLVPLLPDTFVDMPFPGDRQTKFELLNGWQAPACRVTAPHRLPACAVVPHTPRSRRCACASRVTSTKRGVDSSVAVRIDGVPAVNDRLSSQQWLEVNAPLADVPTATRFVCEIEVVLVGPRRRSIRRLLLLGQEPAICVAGCLRDSSIRWSCVWTSHGHPARVPESAVSILPEVLLREIATACR